MSYRPEEIAQDPERFAAWQREQAIRRVEARRRMYQWGAGTLVVLAGVVIGVLMIRWALNERHEREVADLFECQESIHDAEGRDEAFFDYLDVRRDTPLGDTSLRLEQAQDRLDDVDARVDTECGIRR